MNFVNFSFDENILVPVIFYPALYADDLIKNNVEYY
jgi:hypothetical protein